MKKGIVFLFIMIVIMAAGCSAGDPLPDELFVTDLSIGGDTEISGGVTLTGDGRVYKTVWIDAGAIKAPGAKPATAIAHGTLETPAWSFADQAVAGNQETISFTFEKPEDIDISVKPHVYIGWSSTTTSLDCVWQLEYLWIDEGGDTTTAAEDTITVTSTSSSTAEGFIFVQFDAINRPSTDDMCCHCRLTRLSADAADTLNDTAELQGVSFVYTSNRLGSY